MKARRVRTGPNPFQVTYILYDRPVKERGGEGEASTRGDVLSSLISLFPRQKERREEREKGATRPLIGRPGKREERSKNAR